MENDNSKVTKMSRVVMPREINQYGVLSGGFLLSWMDETAGITANRYAEGVVTTAAIEGITFYRPIVNGDFIDITGEMEHVGRSSMKVLVTVTTDGKEGPTAEGRFIYVAVDEDRRPRQIVRRK